MFAALPVRACTQAVCIVSESGTIRASAQVRGYSGRSVFLNLNFPLFLRWRRAGVLIFALSSYQSLLHEHP